MTFLDYTRAMMNKYSGHANSHVQFPYISTVSAQYMPNTFTFISYNGNSYPSKQQHIYWWLLLTTSLIYVNDDRSARWPGHVLIIRGSELGFDTSTRSHFCSEFLLNYIFLRISFLILSNLLEGEKMGSQIHTIEPIYLKFSYKGKTVGYISC